VKRPRLDSAAREELLHEVQYYEATRPGMGRGFRDREEGITAEELFARLQRFG
jgi:hypothetical protein